MNDGLNFSPVDPIVNRALAMGFPFGHLPERTDHGQVHHTLDPGVNCVVKVVHTSKSC